MGRTWASMIQDVGHDRRTAPVSLLSLYEQIIEWDSETPLKRRSEGGVPPRPLQGSALSSPWTLASKVTNPRGLGRRRGPIRQVRRDCLGGAKPHFPPRFRASDSHPPDVAPILRSGAKPLFVRKNSSSPRRPAHNRALCAELNIRRS